MNKHRIYCYTSPSGKKYVGQTVSTRSGREGTDCILYQRCTAFYNAIQKYGIDNFEYETIADNLSQEEANELEHKLITEWDLTNNEKGYNISQGGGGRTLYNYDEIYEMWNKGYQVGELIEMYDCDPKTITKVLNYFNVDPKERIARGSELPQGIKDMIMIRWNEGKQLNQIVEEFNVSKERVSAVLEKNGVNGIQRISRSAGQYHTKVVYQYDKKTKELIKIYNSIAEAERETKVSHGNIIKVCSGERHTAGGYIWSYTELEE